MLENKSQHNNPSHEANETSQEELLKQYNDQLAAWETLNKQNEDKKAEYERLEKEYNEESKRASDKEKEIAKQKKQLKKQEKIETLKNLALSIPHKVRLAAAVVGLGIFSIAAHSSKVDASSAPMGKKNFSIENTSKGTEAKESDKRDFSNEVQEIVKQKFSPEQYKEFDTREARERYLSLIVADAKIQFLRETGQDTLADSLEKDITLDPFQKQKDYLSIVIADHESAGLHGLKNPNSSARGKYQHLKLWLDLLGMNPDSQEDLDKFLKSAALQEKAFDLEIKKLVDVYGDKNGHLSDLSALQAHYIGHTYKVAHYENGVLIPGDPEGDIVPESNNMTPNELVGIRMKDVNEWKEVMKGKGYWIFDNTHEIHKLRGGHTVPCGELCWVDGSTYKVTKSIYFPEIVSGDKNENYVAPLVKDDQDKELVAKMADAFDQQLKVGNFEDDSDEDAVALNTTKNKKDTKIVLTQSL